MQLRDEGSYVYSYVTTFVRRMFSYVTTFRFMSSQGLKTYSYVTTFLFISSQGLKTGRLAGYSAPLFLLRVPSELRYG